MKIAAALRQIRESKNYSQEYMAERLGIGQNTYSNMERGYSRIDIDRLSEILTILDISVCELLSIAGICKHTPSAQQAELNANSTQMLKTMEMLREQNAEILAQLHPKQQEV